ncbi:hypothetical protein TIFTF001_010127 [Ficus carica]|uniref:Uncharacterized protein n=1 Tax=Ficus carica TaxID=3494 RepID=A0AA88D475_FICCA|nr:hypothetical protein TIFTF001_010127 [Ficus carica]
MLDVTLDLITQTASSSLLAFCFCNLIIVIILVGSKPGSEFNQERSHASTSIPLSAVATANTSEKEVLVIPKDKNREEKSELVAVNEVSSAQNAVRDDNDNEDKEDEDDGGDDELRKRVEEFIEKVNRGWKAELSKTSHLV